MNKDITFCIEECKNNKCLRNKNNTIIGTIHSYAYLRNTELCPIFNNEKNNEKTLKNS